MKPPFETESDPPKEGLVSGQEDSFATLVGKISDWTLAHAESLGATNSSGSVASFPEIPGFQIHSELGRGAMGVVYEATQTNLNRRVAIKLLLIDSNELAKRFQLEATALAKIQNGGIVEIFDVGTVGKCPFLVMELLMGGTLAKAISGHQVDSKDAASMTLQMARALVAIHGVGILHRDLKPGNVILVARPPKPDPYGKLTLGNLQLKLCDFGLAKKLDHDSNFMTQPGALMGTPGYMAPEQAMGNQHDLGPPTDIFSLGAILYEMLAGVTPFRGETLLETISMTIEDDPVSLSKLRGGIPIDLETICLKCLEKQPSRRYPSAQALCEDIEAFLANKPIKARPAGSFERSWKWCKRNPTLAASMSFILTGLMIALPLAYLATQSRFQRTNENLVRLQDHLGYVHLLDHDVTTASVWYAASGARQADPQSRLVDRIKMGALMDSYPWIRSYVNRKNLLQGAQWSPSGNLYLTFGDYKSIQVHDPYKFPPGTVAEFVFPRRGHLDPWEGILSVRFLDESKVLALDKEGQLFEWQWKVRREAKRIGDGFTAFTVDANKGFVALARGKKVFVDPTGTPGPTWNDDRTWPEAIAPIEELAFLGSSQKAVLRHAQSLSLANFDPTNLSPKVTHLNGITGPITCMATSPDGSHFAAGNLAGEVAIFSAKGKNMPTLIQAHMGKILCLIFSPNGKFLASGGDDLLATVVDVDAGRIKFQALHEDIVSCVSFTNDNIWFITGSSDNGIRGWHTISGRPSLLSVHCNGGLTFVHSHPTQSLVLTGSKDTCCRLWDYTPKNHTAINFFAPVDQWVHGSQNSIAIRQGTKVRVGSTKPISDAFKSHQGRFVPFDDITYQKSFCELPVRAKTIATWGNSDFVVLSENGSISRWNVLGEKVSAILHPLPGTDLNNIPDANITSSADGNYLVIEGSAPFDYKTIALYHLSGQTGFTQISLPDATSVTSWAFSSTGSMLAWGNRAGDLKIASLQDDKATLVEKPGAHSGTITAMAFSPDGLQIATGGNDMFLRLWNTRQPIQPLWKESDEQLHASAVTVINFHNNGGRPNIPQKIITGSDDNLLRIWDSETGRQTAPPMPHSSTIQTVQSIYLPKMGLSGMNIAGTSTTEGVIYLWDLDSGEILSPLVSIPGHHSFSHCFLEPDSEGRPVYLVMALTGFLYANRMMSAPKEFTDKQLLEFAEYHAATALDKIDGTSLNPISGKELVHRGTEFWKTFSHMFPCPPYTSPPHPTQQKLTTTTRGP